MRGQCASQAKLARAADAVSRPTLISFLSAATEDGMGSRAEPGSEPGPRVSAEVLDAMQRNLSDDDKAFLEEIAIMRRLSFPYIIRYLGAPSHPPVFSPSLVAATLPPPAACTAAPMCAPRCRTIWTSRYFEHA